MQLVTQFPLFPQSRRRGLTTRWSGRGTQRRAAQLDGVRTHVDRRKN